MEVPSRRRREYFFVIFITGLILTVVLLISNEILDIYALQNSSSIAISLGAIGTLVLALVTLISLTQNEKILQHQRDQLEARLRPRIRRQDYYKVDDAARENELDVKLENVGNGKAVNLKLEPRLFLLNSPIPITLGNYLKSEEDVDLPNITSSPSPMFRAELYGDVGFSGGGVLESGSSDTFRTRISFVNDELEWFGTERTAGGLPRIVVFDKLLKSLKNTDIESIAIDFALIYEDVLGNEYRDILDGFVIDVDEVDKLSDVTISETTRWSKEIWEATPNRSDAGQ